jgi:hypothetical protein
MDNDERLARLERKIDFIAEQIILAIAIIVGCVVGYTLFKSKLERVGRVQLERV